MKKNLTQGSNLNKLRGLGGKSVRARISDDDWNFAPVDDSEFVACCYWEYARESNSIRQAVKTVKTALANQGKPHPPSAKHDEFNSAAEKAFGLLQETGFGGDNITFWTGFPKPWQQVDATQRKKWGQVRPENSVVKLPPFQVSGDLIIAAVLHRQAKNDHELRAKLYSEIYDDATDSAKSAELRKKLSATLTPPVVRGQGGVVSFIARINWGDFTDTEIKDAFCKWMDENHRPPEFPNPSKRGHSPEKELRASLERLGIVRLMHQHSFEELTAIVPAEWLDQEKFAVKSECVKERRKALADFHRLFPFLPEENPVSFEQLLGGW